MNTVHPFTITVAHVAFIGLWLSACDVPDRMPGEDADVPDASDGAAHPSSDAFDTGREPDVDILESDALPDDTGIYTIAPGYCNPPCIDALLARCAFAESEPFVCTVYDDEIVSCYRDGIRTRGFTEVINGNRVTTNVRTLLDGRTICFSQTSIEGETPWLIVRDGLGNVVAEGVESVRIGETWIQVFRCNDTGRRYYRTDLDPDREYCRRRRTVPPPGGCQPGACEWLGPR